jgi:hypothetical protein
MLAPKRRPNVLPLKIAQICVSDASGCIRIAYMEIRCASWVCGRPRESHLGDFIYIDTSQRVSSGAG